MTLSVKHLFQSAKGDGPDPTKIQPSNWNAEHFITIATSVVLGRATAGDGAIEELPSTTFGRGIFNLADIAAAKTLFGIVFGTITGTYSEGNHTHAFSVLTSKPTTLAGYGITDSIEPLGKYNAPNKQTGTTYTLVLGDAIAGIIEMNNALASTLTIPPNASVLIPIDTKIDISQYGAGQVTITPGAGVTIRAYNGALKIAGQYGGATLWKRGTDEWMAFGNLST